MCVLGYRSAIMRCFTPAPSCMHQSTRMPAATRSSLSFAAAGCALVGLTTSRSDPVAQRRHMPGVTRLGQGKGFSAASAAAAEPKWALDSSVLEGPTKTSLYAEPIKGVAGAFLVPNALSDGECDRLVALCGSVGFTPGLTLVDVPPGVRNNEVRRAPRLRFCRHALHTSA